MGLGPHPVARARRGLRNCKAAPLGFPPQGRGTATPKKEAPPPGGDEKRLLYVWGWGPSYTAPTCSAGA
eukprot:gene21373-biopygen10173